MSSLSKSLLHNPTLTRRLLLPSAAASFFCSTATPTSPRGRRLRLEPPVVHHRGPVQQRIPGARPAKNPNKPSLPDSAATLSGSRLDLHNRILQIIRSGDLEEASLLTRHSIYSNCRPTVFTCNAVLSALLRAGRYPDFLVLHRFVTQASVAPSPVTHNLLLQAFCDCRKLDRALDHIRLLHKVDDNTAVPNANTYRIVAKALAENGRLDDAVGVKNTMVEYGFVPPDPQVYAFVMGGFVTAGDADSAIGLFNELKEKLGVERVKDGAPYGNLMRAYFLKGMEDEAMSVYRDIVAAGSSGVKFSAMGYNMVLDALGRSGKLGDAMELFERMCREHNPPRRLVVNLGSFNVMVDAYCREGRFQDAITVFGRMGEHQCSPDTMSYNNLIVELSKNSMIAEVEELYRDMAKREVKADEYTHVLLVEACFGVNKVDDAVGYFNKMLEAGLRPNANAYNKVMKGLLNAGRLDDAQGFFDLMPEKEAKPNLESYEMLLKAYVDSARLDDAIKTATRILVDETVTLSDEMKALLEGALEKDGRSGDMEKMYEDAEREKAEAAARAAEEKARAEALAKEEEERKKAEAAEKTKANARVSQKAIEIVRGLNQEKSNGAVEEDTIPETVNENTAVEEDTSNVDENAVVEEDK